MSLVIANPDPINVTYVARNMRDMDAKELFATRYEDDPDALAMDMMTRWGPMWWIAGNAETRRPIAVIGATERWPGMWQVGMFATDEFGQIGLGLTRWVVRRMIPTIRETPSGVRRAEAYSIEGHDVAHRWLEMLGAVREPLPLDGYGKGGETFHKFVWRF